jgi:transcription elongation factor GreB
MSRYRPPRPPSSKYITAEGAARLRGELDFLWKSKRPAVTKAVAEAAAEGDRSENAEYIYGKKQLGEIDRRIRYLRKRLDGMRVVDSAPADAGRIFFGAWFEIEDEAGNRRRCRLVGPDEVGFREVHVSIDSPLGRAALGKALNQALAVAAPQGEKVYTVTAIEYGAAAEAPHASKSGAGWPDEKEPGSRPGQSSQGESR